eukprot:GHVN01016879.1.p1 GENE.GHVN01016879.1~~GHVN01016879.1.p1  ORF type:complete len:137 (-),score=8.39 GHVN01016879.1:241-651(-)
MQQIPLMNRKDRQDSQIEQGDEKPQCDKHSSNSHTFQRQPHIFQGQAQVFHRHIFIRTSFFVRHSFISDEHRPARTQAHRRTRTYARIDSEIRTRSPCAHAHTLTPRTCTHKHLLKLCHLYTQTATQFLYPFTSVE